MLRTNISTSKKKYSTISNRWNGNGLKEKSRKTLENGIFYAFSNIFGNASKLFFWGIYRFFIRFQNYISYSAFYGSYIFEGFPNIFNLFPLISYSYPVFRKSFKLLICWSDFFFFDPFPRMFGLFPRMFGLFPVLNSQFVNQFPTVVGDYINTMKTTVDFNFDFNQSAKQHG